MSEVVNALGRGDPFEVAALIARGADIRYTRDHGYNALLDAAHGRDISRDPRLLDLLALLIANGVNLDAVSSYRESGLRRLSYVGRFDAVRLLLDAGADASQLAWTPLMRAVAVDSVVDVTRELDARADLEALDWWQRTAFHLALMTGDMAKIERLFDRGANPDAVGRIGPALFYAIDGHHPHVVRWLLEIGADVDQADASGVTALMHAVEQEDPDCVDVLLSAGADVARDVFGTALRRARSRRLVERLMAGGADPAHLSKEGHRAVLGLPPDPDASLMTATLEEFRRASTRRFGAANPELMNESFWVGMVRSGISAYAAGQHFGVPTDRSSDPIWCAERFGQSITRLADGRTVQIAGEHEDFYDRDFCIYNDVFVHAPDGSIAIFGYPDTVFPPTDFHTATLIGDAVYVIGSLGYQGMRRCGETPVYRLDLATFGMTRVETRGEAPGWLYGHRADAVGVHDINISGGTIVTMRDGKEVHEPNSETFVLDVNRLSWRRLGRTAAQIV